jgi:hypothetical protein
LPELHAAQGGLGDLRRGGHIALTPPLADAGAPDEHAKIYDDIFMHGSSLPVAAYPSVTWRGSRLVLGPVVAHSPGACEEVAT